MGNVCSGCGTDEEENKRKQDIVETQGKEQHNNKPKEFKPKVPSSLNEEPRIPHKIYKPPIIYEQNEIIFLVTDSRYNANPEEPQYLTRYYIKNLEDDSITAYDIKCDNDDEASRIDLRHSVYALNDKLNKIYFIERNKCIKTLDLKENLIKSLDKEITVTNGNYAQIVYDSEGNQVYIIGAESITNNNNETSDDYLMTVPYSTPKRTIQNKDEEVIQEFGQNSRVIGINDGEYKNTYFIMGGRSPVTLDEKEENVEKKDDDGDSKVLFPTDELSGVKCTDGKAEWVDFGGVTSPWTRHMVYRTHSFGIINYQNRFLIQFGGVEARTKKEKGKNKDNKENDKASLVPKIKLGVYIRCKFSSLFIFYADYRIPSILCH